MPPYAEEDAGKFWEKTFVGLRKKVASERTLQVYLCGG